MNSLPLRLAVRSLFRNPRRLLLSVSLLSVSFTVLVLFRGFETYVLSTMRSLAIDVQFGHLQVLPGEREDAEAPLVKGLIENPKAVASRLTTIPDVRYVTPRVSFYALINYQDKSHVARIVGIDPEAESELLSALGLSSGSLFLARGDVVMTTGVARRTKLPVAGSATIVGQTRDGALNGMDIRVRAIGSSGTEEVDRDTVFIHIKDAQRILDSEAADRLLLRVTDMNQLSMVKKQVEERLAPLGFKVKKWNELAELYTQVEAFYKVQNLIFMIIVLSLILLSTANTVAINVFERLREIGTLRALGDYESDIRRLFIFEAAILGVISILVGTPLTLAIVSLTPLLRVTLDLPFATKRILLNFLPNFGAFLEAGAVCFAAVLIASYVAARRGARTPILSALSGRL
jgi:putative ABC transport system permease protein